MAKKIVVLLGSPRKNGNTEILAEAFIRGAEAAGNTVAGITLQQLEINCCRDCKYCVNHNGECVQKDGMSEVYPALYQADVLVLASPIYFSGFTAQIKKVIDRMYTMLGKEFPITASVLLAPYADTDTAVPGPIIAHYKALARYMKWENKGIITVPGLYQRGDIINHPSLAEAEHLGYSIT
jgi:multimeric flavodoxin WrbA